MMTAIMVDARRPGSSGWTHCRGQQRVRVSGIRGGRIELLVKLLHQEGFTQDFYQEDNIITLPVNTGQVKVIVHETTELTRLFVDLIPSEG